MRAGGGDFQAVPAGQAEARAAQLDKFGASLGRRAANLRAPFDDRLVQLRLDLLLEDEPARLQDLRDVRAQLARDRIDDLVFFLDADGERRWFHKPPTVRLDKTSCNY